MSRRKPSRRKRDASPPRLSGLSGEQRAGVLLLLLAVTAVVYWPITHHPFVLYDDGPYIYENPHVRAGLTRESVWWAFTSLDVSNWHPLTWISHMIDSELHGPDAAGGHHRSALLLHLLNTALTFLVLSRMTQTFWRSLLVAAIFALHPLHVESVAWAAERKDVLSQFFWLLSIGTYVEWTRRGSWVWYGLTMLWMACGLMSKPMLVTAPFLFLLLDFWPLERMATSRWIGAASASHEATRPGRSATRLLIEKLPFFALVGVTFSLTYLAQAGAGSVVDFPLGHRLANAAVGYVRYIAKAVWPSDLAIFYPNHVGMWSTGEVVGALLVLAVITAFIVRYRDRGYPVVGWLWFVGTLVPVIGIVSVGGQSIADRYTYMPLDGLAILVAWGVAERVAHHPARLETAAAAAIVWIAALAWLASNQVEVWSSSRELYAHALRVTEDNHVIHNNLAVALIRDGEVDAAVAHLEESIRIEPAFVPPYINLADIHRNAGRYDEAIATYRRVLSRNPDRHDVHRRLGNALLRRGDVEEATRHLRRALEYEPRNPMVHHDLGLALAMQRRDPEAIAVLEQGLLIDPTNVWLHTTLGNLLLQRGDVEGAIEHHRTAQRLEPEDAGANNTLGQSLLVAGRLEEAREYFVIALRLKPGHSRARANLQRVELEIERAARAPRARR